MWSFYNKYSEFINPIITALISFILGLLLEKYNSKKELEKMEKQHKLDFEKYIQDNTYDSKRNVIYKSLSFLDDYYSWLTFEVEPVRKDISISELTILARECYNELCVSCNNEKIISLFNAIIFSKDTDSLMANFNDYRIAAREELGLESINLNKDVCFISRVSTKELCDQENIN